MSDVTGGNAAEYLVEGMTCAHCVASVTEEVSAVAGVSSVDVELHVGGASVVRVVGDGAVSEGAVRDAVEEAGYTLVGH
ncbi:heavy-metal-associated domain-containing protein [Herbiconiux sp. P15]|uniref:heavy-metal-associated domain-containing protein n=1 Tax=Herbiconiux liukaitaii TaxID=3342799 RepID=UPI0035BA0515